MMEQNYVIEYQEWDSYNANSKEEAIEMFRKDHPNVTILDVKS